MSEFQHEPGSFGLFKNDKGDNPKRPDYRGEGKDLQGNNIEVAAWLKEGKKGKFMSCSFKLAQAQRQADKPKLAKTDFDKLVDDSPDIPF